MIVDKQKTYLTISPLGEVLGVLRNTSFELIEFQKQQGNTVVEAPEDFNYESYYDYADQTLKPKGPRPRDDSLFDFNKKSWIDPRSLEQVKEDKWNQLKKERNFLEFSTFTYNDNVYDSDQVSQGRIMGAALAGVDQVWTTADNSIVSLTGAELLELYQALQAHVASVHERSRIARLAVEEATTKEEVESISL